MKVLESFRWATNGIRTVWHEEFNFRIEVTMGILVVIFGAWNHLMLLEWVIVLGCIGAVLAAEMLNTAIEDLCNKVEPNNDPLIGKIKDIMGGFVLVVVATSTIVGSITVSRYLIL